MCRSTNGDYFTDTEWGSFIDHCMDSRYPHSILEFDHGDSVTLVLNAQQQYCDRPPGP